MTSLSHKKILLVGSGNMARPLYESLVARNDVNPKDVTIICGTRNHSNHGAVVANLKEAGLDEALIAELNIIERTQVDVNALATPDIFIYAAKPGQREEVFATYAPLLDKTENLTLISIAAGASANSFAELCNGKDTAVVRTMPHLPRKVFGLYSSDSSAVDTASEVLAGLGQPVAFKDEEKMHACTAHAGSGPAFVAQFIASFPAEQQTIAATTLKAHAMGELIAANNQVEAITQQDVISFYNNWRGVAAKEFSPENAQTIVNQTIIGSLEVLNQGNISPLDFTTKVRSPKGTTNAGLLYMGNNIGDHIPADTRSKFGTDEEITQQNEIATSFGLEPTCQTIVHALIAATERSIALGNGASTPTEGAEPKKIDDLANHFFESQPNKSLVR